MMYERECPICGIYFKTDNRMRKYCDQCRNKSDRKMRAAAKEMLRSKQMYHQNGITTFTCEYCNKEHSIESRYVDRVKITKYSKLNWDDENHYFCSIEHREKAIHDHTTCSCCGKLLKGCSYTYNINKDYNYCSKECEEIHQHELAVKNGWLHICNNCGKEFIRKAKVAYFCSQDCTKAAKKKGWISPESKARAEERRSKQVEVNLICSQCNKPFTKVYRSLVSAELDKKNLHFCSNECRKDRSNALRRASRAQKAAEASISDTTISVKEQDASMPLCATCKISYKKCERMQSDFTVLPKGAHCNDKGILVECPKYIRS